MALFTRGVYSRLLCSLALCAFALTLLGGPSPASARRRVFVVDQNSGTVHEYSPRGADRGVFASGLSSPSWITADKDGNIYVSEYTGGKVTKFSPLGTILLAITTPYTPGGVAIGSDGSIYVAHYNSGAVSHYSASGEDLGIFASFPGGGTDFIRFDAGGYLYVGDWKDGFIRRISPRGEDLGNFLTGLGGVEGIAFDASGNLYAAAGGSIKKYSPIGVELGTFATPGGYGIAFDRRGRLYVVDYDGTVRKFSPSGKLRLTFPANPTSRDIVVVPVPRP